MVVETQDEFPIENVGNDREIMITQRYRCLNFFIHMARTKNIQNSKDLFDLLEKL